jgi:hypothetical protein
VVVTPSADCFVVESFSLGSFAGFLHRRQAGYVGSSLVETKTTGFAFGLRAGYNWELGPSFSLWPRAGVVFATRHVKQRLSSETQSGSLSEEASVVELEFDETSLAVHLFVPLLIHPVPHFFIGIGPELQRDLERKAGQVKNEGTLIGLASTVGGWF